MRLFSGLTMAVVMSTTPGAATAQTAGKYEMGFFNHVGMQFSVGTEGISVGLGTTLCPYLEAGIGVNFMPSFSISGNMKFNGSRIEIPQTDESGRPVTGDDGLPIYNTYDLGTVKVSGKFERITYDAKLNFYPFGQNSTFFIAGGISLGGGRLAKLSGHSDEVARIYEENKYYTNTIKAVVDQSYLEMASSGDVDAEIRVNKVRPYVGIGAGHLVPHKGLGMRIELGCQFMGKPKIFQNDNEVPYEDALKKADDRLSKLIDHINFYPVLKISLTGSFM